MEGRDVNKHLRYLGLCLGLSGCVPIQSRVSPVNIEGKTFKVELPSTTHESSEEGPGKDSLNSVVRRICPQGFKTLDASTSWNPWNDRIYTYTVQCDDAAREFR